MDPKQIPPRDRGVHIVGYLCSDINLQQTLDKAHNQHVPLIQRLRTRSLRGISRNNQVTHHVKLLGHNLQPLHHNSLINLDIPLNKVHQLATVLHAIKGLNKITKTRHKIHCINNNSDNRGYDWVVTGRADGFRRARRRPDRMADNPPDPH